MIEISDRAFGGISTDAKLWWTTEKFREALVEMAGGEGGGTGRSMSISSSNHHNDDITPTSPATSHETNTQHDVVRQGEVEMEKKQERDDIVLTNTKEKRSGCKK